MDSDMQLDANELRGRHRIFTDEKEITRKNIIAVLQEALLEHAKNASEISYLLNYEKGEQPLKRKKEIRKEIDIKVCDNVANEVTEFKLGYNWGNAITFVQRGNKDLNKSEPSIDDTAISMLNEMLDYEYTAAKDQEMARYVEICGIGYRMIDVKRDYVPGGSVFDVITLNPLFTFIVYSNDALRRPLMACTFRRLKNGNSYYTCFTKDRRYEIKNEIQIVNGKNEDRYSFGQRSGEKNPLGMIPIVEYIRSFDRTGCFERQISDMDNLNILVSDFTNDVAQNTQSIWWGHNIEMEQEDKDGIRSGMWIITQDSGSGAQAMIKALVENFDYPGVLQNIQYRREVILQKCNVPLRSEPGGGSTGTAMSMSSGWQAAEVAASKEELIIRQGKMQELRLIMQAIKTSPDLPPDSPLLSVSISDVLPRIIRNKTYDMATKANTFATYIKNGIHGRHALQVIDAFPDVQQTWLDSKDMIEAVQKVVTTEKTTNERQQQDLSDQSENSPFVNGMELNEKPITE